MSACERDGPVSLGKMNWTLVYADEVITLKYTGGAPCSDGSHSMETAIMFMCDQVREREKSALSHLLIDQTYFPDVVMHVSRLRGPCFDLSKGASAS